MFAIFSSLMMLGPSHVAAEPGDDVSQAPPWALEAHTVEGGNRLEWNAPLSGDVEFYRLHVDPEGEGKYSLLVEAEYTTFLHRNGTTATWYMLTAVGADGGESPPSNPASSGGGPLPYPYCFELVNELEDPPFYEPNQECLCPLPPPITMVTDEIGERVGGRHVLLAVPLDVRHPEMNCKEVSVL